MFIILAQKILAFCHRTCSFYVACFRCCEGQQKPIDIPSKMSWFGFGKSGESKGVSSAKGSSDQRKSIGGDDTRQSLFSNHSASVSPSLAGNRAAPVAPTHHQSGVSQAGDFSSSLKVSGKQRYVCILSSVKPMTVPLHLSLLTGRDEFSSFNRVVGGDIKI